MVVGSWVLPHLSELGRNGFPNGRGTPILRGGAPRCSLRSRIPDSRFKISARIAFHQPTSYAFPVACVDQHRQPEEQHRKAIATSNSAETLANLAELSAAGTIAEKRTSDGLDNHLVWVPSVRIRGGGGVGTEEPRLDYQRY